MNVLALLSRFVRLGALALVLHACLLGGRATSAFQALPSLVLSANPKEATDPITTILLRPNAEQPLFVYVNNPGEEPQKLTVLAKAGDIDLAKATITAPPGKTTLVKLPKIEAPKTEPKPVDPKAPPADKKDKVEWTELSGPPFKLNLVLINDKQNAIQNKTYEMAVTSPVQYVEANGAWEPEKARISVTAKLVNPVKGKPTTVEMVLRPELLPGVVPGSMADGTFKVKLAKAGETKKLVAEGIKFQGTKRDGIVYLNVDGIQRAAVFAVDLSATTGSAPFTLLRDTTLKLPGAFLKPNGTFNLYSAPADKYLLLLDVDTPVAGSGLIVGIDRNKDGTFDEIRLPGPKEMHVWSNPEFPDGGFLFKTDVKDWIAELDTEGLRGEHAVRVQLVDATGQELAKIDGTIMFDATPPEKIAFLPVASKVIKGTKLKLKVQVQDPESPIVKGQFFFGVLKDGKAPPEAVLVDAFKQSKDEDIWVGEVLLPDGKKELEVTGQFTNAAGLSAAQSIKVEVIEAPPPAGTIKGKVTEGDRPQAGVEVQLKDEKELKAATKTNPKGEFVFENVKPGPYNVVCQKKDTKTEGAAKVTVEADKTKEVILELARKAK